MTASRGTLDLVDQVLISFDDSPDEVSGQIEAALIAEHRTGAHASAIVVPLACEGVGKNV